MSTVTSIFKEPLPVATAATIYKEAVETHDALARELKSLQEIIEAAKATHIQPLADRYAALVEKVQASRTVYAKSQEDLHNAIMGKPVEVVVN